jgi:hypothetical protein
MASSTVTRVSPVSMLKFSFVPAGLAPRAQPTCTFTQTGAWRGWERRGERERESASEIERVTNVKAY